MSRWVRCAEGALRYGVWVLGCLQLGNIAACDELAVNSSERRSLAQGSAHATPSRTDVEPQLSLSSWGEGRELAPPRPQASIEVPIDYAAFTLSAPSPAAQEVACGERGVVRLTEDGFASYRLEPFSRIERVVAERYYAAVSLTGFSTLLLGSKSTARYYHGEHKAERFMRTPRLGAAYAYADNDDLDRFWIHFLRDDAMHQFHLDSARFDAQSVNVVELKDCDAKQATRLLSGAFLCTQGQDVIWQQAGLRQRYALADVAPEPIGFASAPRIDQFWVVDAHRGATLVEMSLGRPLRTQLQLRGTALAFDVLGHTLAVVGVQQAPRQFFVQVFTRGRLVFEADLPALGGAEGNLLERAMADRDVCLLPSRPWVVVGGRTGMRVLDYATRTRVWEGE